LPRESCRSARQRSKWMAEAKARKFPSPAQITAPEAAVKPPVTRAKSAFFAIRFLAWLPEESQTFRGDDPPMMAPRRARDGRLSLRNADHMATSALAHALHLVPPNACVHLPARLQGISLSKRRYAGPVKCNSPVRFTAVFCLRR
jgi:hypothetical protein